MKKMIGIYMAILIGILCTGCAPEHREEASIEPSSVSEAKPGETPVSIQIFAPEDVKVTPEIVEYIVTAITFYHPTAG